MTAIALNLFITSFGIHFQKLLFWGSIDTENIKTNLLLNILRHYKSIEMFQVRNLIVK